MAVFAPDGGSPRLVSVNVGRPRTVNWRDRLVTTAIWKTPVSGPVRVEGANVAGDDQADRRVHGGEDKAVYAYAAEDYDWWAQTLGPLDRGTFGENLTTAGLDLNASYIGDRWHVGSAVLQVAQPRSPCFKLGLRLNDETFPGRFANAGRPGVYLRLIVPGVVTTGDPIDVEPAEQPALTIAALVAPHVTADVLRMAVDDPRVPDGWRRSAARALS